MITIIMELPVRLKLRIAYCTLSAASAGLRSTVRWNHRLELVSFEQDQLFMLARKAHLGDLILLLLLPLPTHRV